MTEFHALVMSRLGHAVARRVLAELYGGDVLILRVSAIDEQVAREIIPRSTDKAFL